MIQRQQTLWLLLVAIAAGLTFKFPFATGLEQVDKTAMQSGVELTAGSNVFTLLLTITAILLALVTIFQFKDRKLQLKMCIIGLLVSVGNLAIYITYMQKLIKPTPALWAVLAALMVVGFFLAWRNIRKDEKLVKSLDKLR